MLVGPKEANVKEESKSEEGKKRQVGQLGHVQQLKKRVYADALISRRPGQKDSDDFLVDS